MTKVCVVTGGGSGMGLSAAKHMPTDRIVIVSGRTVSKFENAVQELKGIRVVSLSPGLIATDMGNLETEHGGEMLKFSAEERMGTPEELGFAIATLADERNGYTAGVDVLVDGGTINGQKVFKKKR